MKYIILKDEEPIIFPDSLSHKMMEYAMNAAETGAVAGGTVALRTGHESMSGASTFYVECKGETDIEGVISRGLVDEKLIAAMITKA